MFLNWGVPDYRRITRLMARRTRPTIQTAHDAVPGRATLWLHWHRCSSHAVHGPPPRARHTCTPYNTIPYTIPVTGTNLVADDERGRTGAPLHRQLLESHHLNYPTMSYPYGYSPYGNYETAPWHRGYPFGSWNYLR
jgi:hypothetical protein